jgi:hypothetical protein
VRQEQQPRPSSNPRPGLLLSDNRGHVGAKSWDTRAAERRSREERAAMRHITSSRPADVVAPSTSETPVVVELEESPALKSSQWSIDH